MKNIINLRKLFLIYTIVMGIITIPLLEKDSAQESTIPLKLDIQHIATLPLPSIPIVPIVDNNYCYVTTLDSGLQVIDISNTKMPKILGSVTNLGSVNRLCARNGIAYIASADSGLQLIDITNPEKAAKISSVLSEAYDVSIKDNYAYIVDRYALMVVDISNLLQPKLVKQIEEFYYSTSISIKEDYLYSLHCFYREEYCLLKIVDIKNPIEAKLAAEFDCLMPWDNLLIHDQCLFVAGPNTGIKIFNISEATNPKIIKHNNTPGDPWSLFIVDNKLFLPEGYPNYTGIQVIDITDPASPKDIAMYDMENRPHVIYVNNGYIFVAVEKEGLVILKYSR
jgi:hypothetical protein